MEFPAPGREYSDQDHPIVFYSSVNIYILKKYGMPCAKTVFEFEIYAEFRVLMHTVVLKLLICVDLQGNQDFRTPQVWDSVSPCQNRVL